MGVQDVFKKKRGEILAIAERYGAYNVRVFGSVARNEAGDLSDVDILVSFARGCTLIDLVAFNDELEALLNHKVQVITDGGIHPYLKDRILADAVPI